MDSVEADVPLERHDTVLAAVSLPEDFSSFLYTTLVALCDPYTQPSTVPPSASLHGGDAPHPPHPPQHPPSTAQAANQPPNQPPTSPPAKPATVLSVDLLADVAIALAYTRFQHTSPLANMPSVKFELAAGFYRVVRAIHGVLRVTDELALRYVDNSEARYHDTMAQWTPAVDGLELRLVYSACCVALAALAKLFGDNLALNPYFHYLLKLWKCHTNVIILGLEIDRRLEFTQSEEPTPPIVKQTLKGSSAIRQVLATIINQNPSSLYTDTHDLVAQSLVAFMQPLGRDSVNGGAISVDMRMVIMALLILNLNNQFVVGAVAPEGPPEAALRRESQRQPVLELGDLLLDLEYDDRFDEDIRYVFDYEYGEYSDDEWVDDDPDGPLEPVDTVDTPVTVGVGHGEVATPHHHTVAMSDGRPVLMRKEVGADPIEFDEYGRDWRDCPRGANTAYTDEFSSEDDFFANWDETAQAIAFLATTPVDDARVGQALLNTVSRATREPSDISADKIYDLITQGARDDDIAASHHQIVPIFAVTTYELLLHNNPRLATALMDELLCVGGYRRVLIWFVTHNINLSNILIDYVFELLTRQRGEPANGPYRFTRHGPLELSEVEVSMLLHEFLTNASLYLSARDGLDIDDGYKVVLAESVAKKYMVLLCLMVNQLIARRVIQLDRTFDESSEIYDYSNVLQVLLINWVGKLPEARALFFKVKGARAEAPAQASTIRELLAVYAPLSRADITSDVDTNKTHRAIVLDFVARLGKHLDAVLKHKGTASHPDFGLFLTHFNTFCKIDLAAEKFFEKFEKVVAPREKETEE
ncbi:hypothetical protein DICA4_C07074 [Diutina catenulata]